MVRARTPWGEKLLPRPFERFEREMEDLMERFISPDGQWMGLNAYIPRTNLVETDDGLEVTMDLPGVKPQEIKVELRHGNLLVSGERKEPKEEMEKKYHRMERQYGEFCRTIPLPCEVQEEKVDAEYCGGVLKITLSKSEKAKPRPIVVRTS